MRKKPISLILAFTLLSMFTIGIAYGKPTPKITVGPKHGVPGTTVRVNGRHFTPIAGTEIQLTMNGIDNPFNTMLGTYSTDSKGIFKGTFIIPALAFGDYWVMAEDETSNISIDIRFEIGAPYLK